MTLRKGSRYIFQASGWDRFDPKPYTPADGTEVKVCQPYGCPSNGTMGHCYIEDMNGQFIGLVAIASLAKAEKKK